MFVGQHIRQKYSESSATGWAAEPLHEVPNFFPRSMTCRLRFPCLLNLRPQEHLDGIGNFEADGVTIDMFVVRPPRFGFPAREKSLGDSPFS